MSYCLCMEWDRGPFYSVCRNLGITAQSAEEIVLSLLNGLVPFLKTSLLDKIDWFVSEPSSVHWSVHMSLSVSYLCLSCMLVLKCFAYWTFSSMFCNKGNFGLLVLICFRIILAIQGAIHYSCEDWLSLFMWGVIQ